MFRLHRLMTGVLTRGFLVDCLKRTAFIGVPASVYLHALFGVEVSLFYFSGAAFMCLLIVTLSLASYQIFTRRAPIAGGIWLALHVFAFYGMARFYAVLTKGLMTGGGAGETAALLFGLNTFFIVAVLRALGEQLIENLRHNRSSMI